MLRILLILIIVAPVSALAQNKGKVEVVPTILSSEIETKCTKLVLGKVIFFFEPEFPVNAQTFGAGGAVEVTAKINETGNVLEILNVEGTDIFKELAERAAKKARFSPTTCDSKPIGVSALFSYRFTPGISYVEYFFPAGVEDFKDLSVDSPFFGSIESLTDNYEICFGYFGNKYLEKAQLTRGDFAQFLRMTIDYLFKRASVSKKLPTDIGLITSLNPSKLKSITSVSDINKSMPFYRSVGILLQTYNIALVSDDSKFHGANAMTQNEIIDIWGKIFGLEAVPVNFSKTRDPNAKMSRGEFAIFLNESMQVLSYKVLP
jgi:hypothetical protein